MLRTGFVAFLAVAVLLVPSALARAQDPSPELRMRADQVVAVLNGEADPNETFTERFLAQVPPAQLATIGRTLTGQYGRALAVERIEAQSAAAGVMHVATERGVLGMDIALEPQPPHRIAGLLVTSAELRGDTLESVVEELRTLPGRTSFAVARLEDGAAGLLAAHQPDQALAIGSTFKLFVLAELSRQVAVGERRWDDVVRLDRRSLPTGILQGWPEGSPVTLHTLAALMISISDNSATDMLLHTLGRENVERMMTRIGVSAPERSRPFLGTLEAFALKTAGEDVHGAWAAADEAGRRRMLEMRYAAVDPARLDPTRFMGAPLRIDLFEWFASANDLVRTMDWFRREGGDVALALLAISPGMVQETRRAFAYAGYKGGSEAGVLNLTWLLRDRSGLWLAVTASWNDPEAALDESRFVALVTRAVQLVH